jgi:hypothetical protein
MHEQQRYPHLLPEDALVLTAYLKQHGARYTHVAFDVPIGDGRDPGPDFDNNIRTMALYLSKRRIDALGHTPTEYHIIEVTSDAGTTTLGQLNAYYHLLQSTITTDTPVRRILAARRLQTDMILPYRANDIEIHLYPDA